MNKSASILERQILRDRAKKRSTPQVEVRVNFGQFGPVLAEKDIDTSSPPVVCIMALSIH